MFLERVESGAASRLSTHMVGAISRNNPEWAKQNWGTQGTAPVQEAGLVMVLSLLGPGAAL